MRSRNEMIVKPLNFDRHGGNGPEQTQDCLPAPLIFFQNCFIGNGPAGATKLKYWN